MSTSADAGSNLGDGAGPVSTAAANELRTVDQGARPAANGRRRPGLASGPTPVDDRPFGQWPTAVAVANCGRGRGRRAADRRPRGQASGQRPETTGPGQWANARGRPGLGKWRTAVATWPRARGPSRKIRGPQSGPGPWPGTRPRPAARTPARRGDTSRRQHVAGRGPMPGPRCTRAVALSVGAGQPGRPFLKREPRARCGTGRAPRRRPAGRGGAQFSAVCAHLRAPFALPTRGGA